MPVRSVKNVRQVRSVRSVRIVEKFINISLLVISLRWLQNVRFSVRNMEAFQFNYIRGILTLLTLFSGVSRVARAKTGASEIYTCIISDIIPLASDPELW